MTIFVTVGVPQPSAGAGRVAEERGSVGLEVLVVTPLLATLVLFVVWAGNSGRSNLAASLAVEEAAVAAAVVCVGDDGIDSGCVESVAGQVVANRVPFGIACTPPPESGESTAEPGRSAVVVSADCGVPAGGEQFTSSIPDTTRRHTGVHVLLDDADIPVYTGDRPILSSYCSFGWTDENGVKVTESFPKPPFVRQPGNATPELIHKAIIFSSAIDLVKDVWVRCFNFDVPYERYRPLSNEVILKVWTQDNQNSELKDVIGGDTCHDYENTGVRYLRIPEQFPQYLRIVPGDTSQNHQRLFFPAGVCWIDGVGDNRFGGVFELHVEIVSGGTGHRFFYCDGRGCVDPEKPTSYRRLGWTQFMDCNGVSPPRSPSRCR